MAVSSGVSKSGRWAVITVLIVWDYPISFIRYAHDSMCPILFKQGTGMASVRPMILYAAFILFSDIVTVALIASRILYYQRYIQQTFTM